MDLELLSYVQRSLTLVHDTISDVCSMSTILLLENVYLQSNTNEILLDIVRHDKRAHEAYMNYEFGIATHKPAVQSNTHTALPIKTAACVEVYFEEDQYMVFQLTTHTM